MNKQVLIVGCGLAGLSAAAVLAQRGLSVTLLESRPRLGGRAGSFLDRETGEWIDTCQHVSMGCCTNLAHFCRMVGIDDLFQEESELTFIGPSGERCRFRANPGPAPLHLARALMGLRYLSFHEKVRLAFDLRELARSRWATADDVSFSEWLDAHSRTANVRDRFWDVILVSALSETAERISVPAARKVFVDGFLANRDGWRVSLPTVPLDELYGQRLTDWLTSHGAVVRTLAGVEQLEERTERVVVARLRSGERIEADEFILAVPWHRVRDIVPPSLADDPMIAAASRLESAPISSVHLWFDRRVLDVPHAVLVGRLSQWVFARPERDEDAMRSGENGTEKAGSGEWRVEIGELRVEGRELTAHSRRSNEPQAGVSPLESEISDFKSQISNLKSPPSTRSPQPSYLQVVISASRGVTAKPQAEVVAEVVDELAELWPQVREATLLHARVVTEHRAVFSPLPGARTLRPAQQSPIGNLQLSGDWTNTGWPATMEGAVRSGFLAAENVLRRAGRSESLVQTDLPVGRVAQWLFGLRGGDGR